MVAHIRIPRPSYLLSQLAPRERPDAALYQVFTHLAELYQLGSIHECYRAPQSVNSLNFVVMTSQGKFIFRRHRLSEQTVAHEHQVLGFLQQRSFPSPRVLLNPDDQAWSVIDGALYSVYEFAEGYCPADFWWWPSARRDILCQAGRTLGEYHQAVVGLVPSFHKWDGYRPAEHRRWREGGWFRQALRDIRPILQKPTANSPLDDWARSHIDALGQMLRLEQVVEARSDLSKLVIHGDYAPWHLLLRPGQPPFVLDFNAARLDLKIFDIVLATFWFAWRGDRLDLGRAMAFQTGYCETGRLRSIDARLASPVFQWLMARAVSERLRRHYQEHVVLQGPSGPERFYKMCVLAQHQPQQLVAGLK
jgi:Ser/Thr protein kinase RdoA (MazF antagonist)